MLNLSNGYDDDMEGFTASRSPVIGVSIVRSWAQSLPAGARFWISDAATVFLLPEF